MYDHYEELFMFFDTANANLSLPISIENDLEADANGTCQLVTLIFAGDNDEPTEIRVPLEGIVGNLIDYYREVRVTDHGHMQLYAIANEFEKAVDELRDVASQLEDHILYGDKQLDLFDDNDD